MFYSLAKKAIFQLDAETAHGLTIKSLKTGLMPPCAKKFPALEKQLFGFTFPNPVGLAAGFDKNAEVIRPMLEMGFGFVEVGTVTPKPQVGNPKPRIFRDIKNNAIINRMGFPNKGLHVFKKNLEKFRHWEEQGHAAIVGVNIGMNKDQMNPAEDYKLLIRELSALASYLTINISSPNTPGLRDLQKKDHLAPFLDDLIKERDAQSYKRPLLLKLAPDLTEKQQEEIADVVMNAGIDGLILTNTTLERPHDLDPRVIQEKGGLSGQPLKHKSTEIIRNFKNLTKGAIPIIGVGGIASAQDAREKLVAGANLLQLYTGLVYQGPTLPRKICEGL
ncbi:MAG: quinone-dependent dihydroorotate dehydrogenase [Rhodospirillales bacterium]|nr:quinone-dependent dihydroorotate dehydrogenase [Rhodospirillales bacterium]